MNWPETLGAFDSPRELVGSLTGAEERLKFLSQVFQYAPVKGQNTDPLSLGLSDW